MSWRWFDRHALGLLHDESLAAHGTPDIADLAAAYGARLIRSHPFVDGNKRAGFVEVGLVLGLNGHRLVATQADATLKVLALAAGNLEEKEFAEWIRRHAQRRR